MHHADSNYKVMMKTIKWLPMCHHYVLVPPNDLSTKSYFHCPVSLDYMKSNWDKIPHTSQGVDENVMKEKINYFPLGVGDLPEPESFPLPDKKILVFNHRWNQSTGIKKLIQFTEHLDRDEWLVWITDDDAKKPKAGKPAPDWMKVQNLPSGGQYRYLIDNCYATICLVNDYMTWNLSVQDAIKVKKPSLTFKHSTQEYVLGKDYPLYFTDKKSFLELLDNTPTELEWELPEHDKIFKDNLINDLIEGCESKKKRTVKTPSAGIEWLYHILKDNGFKKNLLFNSHPNLYLSNVWEKIRLWCLSKGIKDNPNYQFTKLFVPDDKREDIQKFVDDSDETFSESKVDPNFKIIDEEDSWF
jgi:hypothetical protein